MTVRVLLVDDEPSFCDLMASRLTKRGFDVLVRTSADEALAVVDHAPLDVVVTDLNMPGIDGAGLCHRIVENRPDVPVIVLTGFGSLDTAVAAIRAGAYDFLTKPIDIDTLAIAVERAERHRRLGEEVKRLRQVVEATRPLPQLIGESAAIEKLRDLVARVADTDATVLVTGESGAGKEVVARALHASSRRSHGPFIAINCAAMPENLLESELFGHVRGAFTDAHAARVGLFAQANGGTLFLDEIGDMPLTLQPKILRALEDRKVRPVGGSTEISIDVRVVAATNQDLEARIEEKLFREDLFFRINVLHIPVPPLRSRAGDILLIAQHFVCDVAKRFGKEVTGISPPAAQRLLEYDWPGNVRELRNCIERAVALARYEELRVDDLPEKIQSYRASHVVVASDDPSDLVTLAEVEKRYILRVLESVQQNRTTAAKVLGVDRRTLYRKLEAYGVETRKV
jgi:two-component system response regulator HydG